jgi:hypothetical protein
MHYGTLLGDVLNPASSGNAAWLVGACSNADLDMRAYLWSMLRANVQDREEQLEGALADTQSRLNAATACAEQMADELAGAGARIGALEAELADCQERSDSLDRSLAAAQASSRTALAQAEAQTAAVRWQAEQLCRERVGVGVEALRKQNSALKRQLADAQERLALLQGQLDTAGNVACNTSVDVVVRRPALLTFSLVSCLDTYTLHLGLLKCHEHGFARIYLRSWRTAAIACINM